ncbi:MAG TPA: Ig-like domain-containing protein, partial [Rheinheimera sp.]|uniref:beta strand repeat-containing protein n=1 Tax=Rheinheimera sp. TaxID=1869214 RepID=UPI002F953DCF
APANDGGTAITTYTATASTGGATGSCAGPAACNITVNGLTNGTAYTFTVTATNAKGTSVASAASNAVTPKAAQTITFANPGAQNFGTTPTLTATSDSGLTVTFSSSTTGVCTISVGGTLTFVTAGSCTINADQPGDAATNAATTVSQTFTVNAVAPGAPTIGTATAGSTQASVTFAAPASSGGATITSYTVTSNPDGFTGTGAGSPIIVTGLNNGTAYTFTVTATNTAGTGAASAASNSITPAAPQTITFANPGAQNFGTTPTLTATSDSGLTPTFTSSTTGVCTITTGGVLTFVTAGTCTINADQAGNTSYLPATQVSRSFTVNPVVPAAPTSPVATAGDTQASVAFVAPVNTGGSAITSYTVTTNPADVAPVNGAASPIVVTGLTNGQAYTFTVTANNAAGTGPASAASNSITPAAIQTISFANPGAQNFGSSPTLTATSDSGLTPTFTSSTTAVCTITSGGALTFVTAGSCTINADQAGNASYLPATQVSRTFAVNAVLPGAPIIGSATEGNTQATVNFAAPASNGGAAISSYTVTSNPGNFTASGASAPLTVTGLTNGTAYTFTVTATNSAGTSAASGSSNSVTPQQSNRAPTIGGAPATTVLQGNAYSFVPTASDADNDTLSFSITNLPVWAQFNTSTGALSGTPTAEHIGTTAGIVITVTDGEASASLQAFSITVANVNEAPEIGGTPATSVNEGEAYSFVPTASDADNDTLSFSITNLPVWASFNPDNGALTGTPTAEHVGTTAGIVISVSDGKTSASLPAFSLQVINVNAAPTAEDDTITLSFNNDGIYLLDVLGNDTDPDGDNLTISFASASIGTVTAEDGLLQYTAPQNFSGTVAMSYSVSDGEFSDTASVNLSIDGSNPNAPVITVPDDLTVNATGLFTKVDVGVATAHDSDDQPIAVKLDKNTLQFAPGLHQLYWSATDKNGVSSTATQLLQVQPLVSMSKAQTVKNNSSVTVNVLLNGESPVYPVDITYSVSGSANAADHNLTDGSVQITSGLSANISFDVYADLTDSPVKDIVISLDSALNPAADASVTVSVTEGNLPPTVRLTVMQQGIATSLVTPNAGPVTLLAEVSDANPEDSHSFIWTAAGVDATSTDAASISLDPSGLVGVQRVQVSVTDSANANVVASAYFRVIDALPVLGSNKDSDKDGINDLLEGSGDNDDNGIPDYLDNMPSSNILPQQGNSTNAYLIECDPGVRCGLGLFARSSNSGGVQILDEELGTLDDLIVDPAFEPVGGIFDFTVRDLPTPGQSVRIALPQRSAIPANAVYRKFQRGQWITFTQDDANVLHSAAGSPGYCPPPGSAEWQPGLIAGSWCVRLTIEDGGPNDDDGVVNSAVVDPGTVAMPITVNSRPQAAADSFSGQWNQVLQLTVLDNDSDADGDALNISQAIATFGTVAISEDGQSLWYTPPQNFIGEDTLSYTINDGNNASANAAVTVNVVFNSAPVLADSSASTDDKTPIDINVLQHASDADGDTLSISSATAQTGTVAITAAQTLRYTPKAGFSGTDEISVQISDGRGGTAQAKVSVTVQAVPPVVTPPEKSSGGAFNPWLLALLALSVLRRSRYNRRR